MSALDRKRQFGRVDRAMTVQSRNNQKTAAMTVRLNKRAYEHAKRLIDEGKFIDDERDAWAEHHPSTRTENEFIERSGFSEYGKWFLGINKLYGEDRTRYYEFPFGDFENVHRCGILAAQSRAAQEKYLEVEKAAADLLAVISISKHEDKIPDEDQ